VNPATADVPPKLTLSPETPTRMSSSSRMPPKLSFGSLVARALPESTGWPLAVVARP
jgi:hypothetical protein